MTDLINSLKTLASSPSLRSPERLRDLRRNTITGLPLHAFQNQPMRDTCTESGFAQWRDAMRMVARLPGGLPTEFRLRLWENLADRWLAQNQITWEKIQGKITLGNPRDHEIAEQINKDLHRTGCTGFSGQKQIVLKEILVAFARWNGEVGYCQGLNMIGATLLQMTSGDSRLSLKILIFIIEGVLPQGYFSQGLNGLAVDLAVFREILKNRKPTLHAHLTKLQKRDNSPPLTDVFTMHWFLTLFIHCLPSSSVLRIWDLLLLEGSEVLLRAALVLWAAIETRVLAVRTTDEFYSVMGVITREMIEFGLLDPNSLVKCIVSLGSFPYPGLYELRERHRNPANLHKSFFLPKKELDALKRHYAAIRHRQKNTTIILKNMDTSLRQNKPKTMLTPRLGQLYSTKRGGGLSPKPKIRRQSSSKSQHHQSPSGIVSGRHHQVTLNWDKTSKKPKKTRKRRPSASSITTTSSSSTELCDTDSEIEGNKEINECSVTPGLDHQSSSPRPNKHQPPPEISITPTPTKSMSFEETEAELILLTEKSETRQERRPLDTSDSQYFLDELSRIDQLRKSYGMTSGEGKREDNFYENLSQRICQLQFQNLALLTQVSVTNDKQQSLVLQIPTASLSPLPSPISPILSFHDYFTLPPFESSISRSQSPIPLVEASTANIEPIEFSKISSSSSSEAEREVGEDVNSSTNEDSPQIKLGRTDNTGDEITTIIRENLEILKRLKLKAIEHEFLMNHSESEDASESSNSDSGSDRMPLPLPPITHPPHHHHHRRKVFNPFPTSRKPRVKTTKFGLYK